MRPAAITVLGHGVRVRDMPEQADESVFGYCDTAKESIFIKPSLTTGAWETTLCHEFVHYASDELGLGLTEVQVSGVGAALYSAGVRFR